LSLFGRAFPRFARDAAIQSSKVAIFFIEF
jgi:hypothetical protein